MTDKINGQGLRPADTAGTRRAEAHKAARGESSARQPHETAGTAPGDTVNITRSGLLMRRLEGIVHNAPAADAERVAAFKDAIASGSYEVDNQKVADKLLRFEQSLRD
jgi:negative regulator of flagellin synthesis FlgM